MPYFESFPYPCRYNTLRLLGYDYNSLIRLCAITLVTDCRRPVFADMPLAKGILASLLSDETLARMRLRAFTLMPNHLHILVGVREPELYLPRLIGQFKRSGSGKEDPDANGHDLRYPLLADGLETEDPAAPDHERHRSRYLPLINERLQAETHFGPGLRVTLRDEKKE